MNTGSGLSTIFRTDKFLISLYMAMKFSNAHVVWKRFFFVFPEFQVLQYVVWC